MNHARMLRKSFGSNRKMAIITHGKKGGYIATFPDRDPEEDTAASTLAAKCIRLGYGVKYELGE